MGMDVKKVLPLYIGILIVTVIALFLIKYLDISYPLTVTSTTKSTELAVVGEGKIEVVPDLATVNAGITVNNAATVQEVEAKINEVNNKLIAAMKALGIEEKDIKTSNYSINPDYNYEGGKNTINGYSGNASITIKVRKMDLISKVIEEATKNGANQIYGSQFSVENPEKFREQARNKAIENAKEQAQKLANTLGIRLGRVVNIVESSPSSPYYPVAMKAMEGRGGVSEVDIEPGSQTISSTVTLYFEKR